MNVIRIAFEYNSVSGFGIEEITVIAVMKLLVASKKMKYYLYILFFLTSSSCELRKENIKGNQFSKHLNDSLSTNNDSEDFSCKCTDVYFGTTYSFDFSIDNHISYKDKEKAIFEKWGVDSLRHKVKSIEFRSFDTIPDRFSVFDNVEQIIISGYGLDNGICGLTIFPNLKSLIFHECHISLSKDKPWFDQIERLHLFKTRISHLQDFCRMPNLKELSILHAGFDSFPINFNELKCLSKIDFREYSMAEFNLSEVDLTILPCIKEVNIVTGYKAIRGIPLGLGSVDLRVLNIKHPRLTYEEKEKIRIASH